MDDNNGWIWIYHVQLSMNRQSIWITNSHHHHPLLSITIHGSSMTRWEFPSFNSPWTGRKRPADYSGAAAAALRPSGVGLGLRWKGLVRLGLWDMPTGTDTKKTRRHAMHIESIMIYIYILNIIYIYVFIYQSKLGSNLPSCGWLLFKWLYISK